VWVRLVHQECLRSCLLPLFQEIVVIPGPVRSVVQTTLPAGQDKVPPSESSARAALAAQREHPHRGQVTHHASNRYATAPF
jgi:hypothetical protein